MNKERKYPIAYRPKTCLVNLTVKYYPKHIHDLLCSGEKKKVNHAMKSVKTLKCEKIRMILDYNLEPPTESLKKITDGRIWKQHRLKENLEDYLLVFRDIKIISESRVSYDFDEFIH